MTPEERAAELAASFNWDEENAAGTYAIELAIRAAVLEEREACAKLAQKEIEDYDDPSSIPVNGEAVAAAIRARVK